MTPDEFYQHMEPILKQMIDQHMSYRDIATELNRRGQMMRSGRPWSAEQVGDLARRLDIQPPGHDFEGFKQELLPKLQQLLDEEPTYKAAADKLNKIGMTARSGRPWTDKSLHAFATRAGVAKRCLPTPADTRPSGADGRVRCGKVADYDVESQTGRVVCGSRILPFERRALTNCRMVPKPGDQVEFETNPAGKIDALRITRAPTAGEQDILALPPYRDPRLSMLPLGARMHKG